MQELARALHWFEAMLQRQKRIFAVFDLRTEHGDGQKLLAGSLKEGLALRLGIAHVLARHPRRLSQGERQRAAVCRALVTGPPLLLADEPTGNLDPPNKDLVLAALFEICREQGATLLTVTHDRDLVPQFDRAIDVKSFYSGAPG